MNRKQIQKRREVIRANRKLGWSYEELARKFHLQLGTVYEICQEPNKNRQKTYNRARKVNMVTGRNREIHDRYERGESATELGQVYGMSRQRVYKIVSDIKKYDRVYGKPLVPGGIDNPPAAEGEQHGDRDRVQGSTPADGGVLELRGAVSAENEEARQEDSLP